MRHGKCYRENLLFYSSEPVSEEQCTKVVRRYIFFLSCLPRAEAGEALVGICQYVGVRAQHSQWPFNELR